MIYRAIGVMSGSSLDGLDLVFTELEELGGKWKYEIKHAETVSYSREWIEKLRHAPLLSAIEYMRLHIAFGRFIGLQVNHFIASNNLQHKVQLISSHGHTVFHEPANHMTAQIGDGAAIAAVTGINVVSDLRAMDVALGGQGAPIVPMGEKLLFPDSALLLNLGGIANITAVTPKGNIAFDICPANRVLNMLAADGGLEYDMDGMLAAKGFVRDEVLAKMNQQAYYKKTFPKSLANNFGTDVIYPLLKQANLSAPDALRTMVEHISIQLTRSTGRLLNVYKDGRPTRVLVTGGGAHNNFMLQRLQSAFKVMGISIELPGKEVIDFKEGLIMALLGVLRWREENTVLNSVTGAKRSSIGGAVWMGQEA